MPFKNFFLYFLVMLCLSAAGNFLILRNAEAFQKDLKVWYILHIIWISAIVFTGSICWKNHPKKWLLTLWLSMYLFAFLLFFILGAIDNFMYRFPNVLRKDISKIRLFFFGPVPFVIIFLISRLASQPAKISNPWCIFYPGFEQSYWKNNKRIQPAAQYGLAVHPVPGKAWTVDAYGFIKTQVSGKPGFQTIHQPAAVETTIHPFLFPGSIVTDCTRQSIYGNWTTFSIIPGR